MESERHFVYLIEVWTDYLRIPLKLEDLVQKANEDLELKGQG